MATTPRAPQWNSVPEILADCVVHRPDVELIVEPGAASLTATQLLDRTLRGAQALHLLGVRPGTYVGVDTAALGWCDAATAYLSTVWLGAVAVLSMGEVTERVAVRATGMALLVTAPGRTQADGLRPITPAQLSAAERFPGSPRAGPTDRLDLVFTSGTTGEPKPVASSHAQWTGSVRPELMRSRARRAVGHCGVPIGLSGGVHGIMINHIARGVTSVCAASASQLRSLCRSRPIDELHMPPNSARALARLIGPDDDWAASIRTIRTVGGPLPSPVAADLAERFPRARVVSFYGLTEGGSALLMRSVDRTAQDSIGRPAPGTEVRVLGPDGADHPPGQVGELAVRAPGADQSPDGWVRTGDIGFLDAGNEVRLVGRAAELVFLRGGRVSPEAVEEILSRRIPRSVEFAVAGMPTVGSWDRIAVFLSGDTDSAPVSEARRNLERTTGPFRPHLVRVVPRIPRGPLGKPLRRQLLLELASEA